MHVPDGFLDLPTSLGTAVVAAGGVAICLVRARRDLDDRLAPMAGLAATFVFAGQMINFPVGAGTSGHLLGGALLTALVGPWIGTLCLTVVLAVQALLFADGGITALGTNITLMALVGVWSSWAIARAVLTVLPRRVSSVAPASAIAALISVPLTAAVFAGLYAVGGAVDISVSKLFLTMISWHAVIGVGEALITFFVVAAVASTRPDLVYLGRSALATRELELRNQEVAGR